MNKELMLNKFAWLGIALHGEERLSRKEFDSLQSDIRKARGDEGKIKNLLRSATIDKEKLRLELFGAYLQSLSKVALSEKTLRVWAGLDSWLEQEAQLHRGNSLRIQEEGEEETLQWLQDARDDLLGGAKEGNEDLLGNAEKIIRAIESSDPSEGSILANQGGTLDLAEKGELDRAQEGEAFSPPSGKRLVMTSASRGNLLGRINFSREKDDRSALLKAAENLKEAAFKIASTGKTTDGASLESLMQDVSRLITEIRDGIDPAPRTLVEQFEKLRTAVNDSGVSLGSRIGLLKILDRGRPTCEKDISTSPMSRASKDLASRATASSKVGALAWLNEPEVKRKEDNIEKNLKELVSLIRSVEEYSYSPKKSESFAKRLEKYSIGRFLASKFMGGKEENRTMPAKEMIEKVSTTAFPEKLRNDVRAINDLNKAFPDIYSYQELGPKLLSPRDIDNIDKSLGEAVSGLKKAMEASKIPEGGRSR